MKTSTRNTSAISPITMEIHKPWLSILRSELAIQLHYVLRITQHYKQRTAREVPLQSIQSSLKLQMILKTV